MFYRTHFQSKKEDYISSEHGVVLRDRVITSGRCRRFMMRWRDRQHVGHRRTMIWGHAQHVWPRQRVHVNCVLRNWSRVPEVVTRNIHVWLREKHWVGHMVRVARHWELAIAPLDRVTGHGWETREVWYTRHHHGRRQRDIVRYRRCNRWIVWWIVALVGVKTWHVEWRWTQILTSFTWLRILTITEKIAGWALRGHSQNFVNISHCPWVKI